MAPSNNLDWSEPCQQWRYPKFCPTAAGQKNERPKSAVELGGKEANTAYKKFCKFLRRLSNKKRKSIERCILCVCKRVGMSFYGFLYRIIRFLHISKHYGIINLY